MRVRRGGGRTTRGERRRKREREKSSLDPGVSRKTHERRTSSFAKERERTEVTRYSPALGSSLYRVAFRGIRMIAEILPILLLLMTARVRHPRCLAKRVWHEHISRKNIPSLSRQSRYRFDRVGWILRSTGFIGDWKGAKRRSRSLRRARDSPACWRRS